MLLPPKSPAEWRGGSGRRHGVAGLLRRAERISSRCLEDSVQASSKVTYIRPSSSQYGYHSAPIGQSGHHQQQPVYGVQSDGMMPPPNPALGGGAVSQPLHQYHPNGYGPRGPEGVDRVVVPPHFYGLPENPHSSVHNTYPAEGGHYPTPRGVAARVRRCPTDSGVGSSSCSSSVQATANVRLHEPVSAVYGAYRQYDGSSGNSYTYTSQTAFKATTGAMRSTAVILLMGSYSEELCLSAKQAILMVPGVLAVTTQQ
ncbi:hypothetical protein FOZ63_031933, partial [Perkinsus olseni]